MPNDLLSYRLRAPLACTTELCGVQWMSRTAENVVACEQQDVTMCMHRQQNLASSKPVPIPIL